jgi:hypothetical protein
MRPIGVPLRRGPRTPQEEILCALRSAMLATI